MLIDPLNVCTKCLVRLIRSLEINLVVDAVQVCDNLVDPPLKGVNLHGLVLALFDVLVNEVNVVQCQVVLLANVSERSIQLHLLNEVLK